MKNYPSGFLISLVIAAIVILLILIYNALFPKAYWQSRELEQNRAKWESQHITIITVCPLIFRIPTLRTVECR